MQRCSQIRARTLAVFPEDLSIFPFCRKKSSKRIYLVTYSLCEELILLTKCIHLEPKEWASEKNYSSSDFVKLVKIKSTNFSPLINPLPHSSLWSCMRFTFWISSIVIPSSIAFFTRSLAIIKTSR